MDWAGVASSLFVAAAAVGLLIYVQRRSQAAVAAAKTPAAKAPTAPPAAGSLVEPPTLTETMQGLSTALEAQGEKTTHPRELIGFPDFQRAVALLADPGCDLNTVRLYAFGRLWTLAAAAFEALRSRPDRQELLASTLSQLRGFSPGLTHFVLRYIESLYERPCVGEAVVIAESRWGAHSMLIESFREHFDARRILRDAPRFGEALNREDADLEGVETLLKAIDHPYATALLADLAAWKAGRVNERALSAFGRFWRAGSDDLLVEPESWREGLARAEQAILGAPPRSILVTGGPRMGKTSFLKLLGARLAAEGWRVFEATAAELMADQMYIGQLEGRIRQTIAELQAGKHVAWCVGDLQQLARSGTHHGQAASVLDQIWPAVAAGRLVILAEADPDGASRTLQMRPSLAMHLELIRLSPFDDLQLKQMAVAVAEVLEAAHGLVIGAQTREAALRFSQQYLRAASAPGVVADVLKRAAERVLAGDAGAVEVTPALVIEAVSQMTGLPPEILNDDQAIDLDAVRGYFAERVIGQDEAIATVVDRIAMLKAGLVDPSKPIGVFLFAGPTGTGKTELAKTLAGFLFSSPDRLVRLDMSEFQTQEAVAKIVGERGTAPGSDPLVERIRKQPFSVLLLDEFEKAHANIWDLFLQVFDDGRLSDANGHTVDFRNTIIILTSNLGAASHRSAGIGFNRGKSVFTEHQVVAAVERTFRPEFINRLDRIVVFKPLSRALMYQILRKELAEVLDRRGLRNRDWAVEWETSALDFLLDRGFSPEMGARPLKRAIDQYLLAPLAATLVEHRFPQGDQFLFVRSNGAAIEVEFLDPNADEAAAEPAPSADTGLTLPGLILRPQGDADVRAFLLERQGALQARLGSPDWVALKERLTMEAADPEIWRRADRADVFAGLNLMDRVREAAAAAERLGRRLASGAATADPASRDLVARLAQQLWPVDAGITDALAGSPADAVIAVETSHEGGEGPGASAWSEQVLGMYAAWAERRRMQFKRISPPGSKGPPVLVISGFGAYRTLAGEVGLHVLEHPADAPQRREIARVRVIENDGEEAAGSKQFARLTQKLAAAGDSKTVVRRYRPKPSPLVRDSASGQRSGHLDQVLGGDFDLVFAPPAG